MGNPRSNWEKGNIKVTGSDREKLLKVREELPHLNQSINRILDEGVMTRAEYQIYIKEV